MRINREPGRTNNVLGRLPNHITLYRILVPLIILLVWELGSLWLGARFLPGPIQTTEGLIASIRSGGLLSDTMATLEAVVVSFILATIGGGILGISLGLKRSASAIVEPFILSFYAVPKIIFYPMFLILFSVSFDTKVAYATFTSIFPMTIITMNAVKEIDDVYFDLIKSLQIPRYKQFRYVILPSILVQAVVALRLTFNGAFIGVILVELFASRSGLGLVLQHALGTYDSEQIMIVVTVLSIIAFIANLLFYTVQQRLEQRWNMASEEGVDF